MPEKKNSQREINKDTAEEDIVRLPPVLGIRPGVYLAVIYSLVILLVLFLITLYPGLKNPGTVFSVTAEPQGAAVRLDGVYMGSAPCDIFVPAGIHQIEVVSQGFADYREEIKSDRVIFLTLIFPKKNYLLVELKSPNPGQAFIDAAAEFAAWSFYGESTAANQVPLVLSGAAYRLGKYAVDPAIRSGMKETALGASRFAITRSCLRDLIRTEFLLDSQGQSPSSVGILDSLTEIVDYLDKNPGAALWLAETLPQEAVSQLTSSAWYTKAALAAGNTEVSTGRKGRQITAFGGLRFTEIINENRQNGNQTAYFYIAETQVPLDLWTQFLDEKPQWRADNRESLIEEGLVNSQYLQYSGFPGLPENTAAWVSWHSAFAWCEWYNSKTPGLPGRVRLPLESEWEIAANTGLNKTGDFWEWCEDPFVPLNFLPASLPASDPGSPERPVRGGSWINPQYMVSTETRGSLPPDSCSPFVSFRPVIVASHPVTQ